MIQVSGLTFGDDGYIHGRTELFMVISEELSYPAFESIPAYRITDLATHGYTQTGVVPARVYNDYKMGRMITSSLPPDSLVFARAANPAKPGQGLFIVHPMVRLLARDRRGQTLAAPGTPTPDYIRTGLGTHPLAEAVGTLATDSAWLKCTLHDLSAPVKQQVVDFCEKHF